MGYENDKDQVAQETLKRIEAMKNVAGKPLFNKEQEQTHEIQIKIDNSLEHGRFYPSKIYPGQWRATEQTFRAMKKNIFALGEDLDELTEVYTCESCKTELDKQFWNFCPFCGEGFKS